MSQRGAPTDNVQLIRLAFDDFLLDRRARHCTAKTLELYRYTISGFLDFLQETDQPPSNRAVRAFLASVAERGVKDTTLEAHARGIRAFQNFAHQEDWIDSEIKVSMPRVAQKDLPSLNPTQVNKALDSCLSIRDRAIILLMADTGLRRS